MRGDLVAYRERLSLSPDFVLMAPFGGPPTRPNPSEEAWAAIARFFEDGQDSSFELVQAYHSPQMVVLAGIERTRAKVGGCLDLQPWALRVTLVFAEQGGQWRLAHRHADPLVHGISLQHAAELGAGRCRS